MNADKYFLFIMSIIVSGIITETSISIIDSYAQEQGKVSTLTSTLVNLELRDIEVGESPTGLIYVKGTAINNSTFDTRDVKVLVNLFDVNNSTVSETSRFITPASSTFKPGYERDFYFFVSANNVDHYVITAQGEKGS
jgi:hypothetical protein